MAKTTRDMGPNRLYFRTKLDTNGNTYTVVLDVDNKLFARDRFWVTEEFLTLGKKDFRQLITKLFANGFKEVE